MKKALKIILCSLIFIGALNWGLVGILKFDLVAYLFGEMSLISRIIYAIIGVSALIALIFCQVFGDCKDRQYDC